MALEYLKVVKQFDIVVDAYKSGQEMDLNELPTPESIALALRQQKGEDQVQNSSGMLKFFTLLNVVCNLNKETLL